MYQTKIQKIIIVCYYLTKVSMSYINLYHIINGPQSDIVYEPVCQKDATFAVHDH